MRNQKSPQAKSAINPALEQLAKVRAKEEMILREAESAVRKREALSPPDPKVGTSLGIVGGVGMGSLGLGGTVGPGPGLGTGAGTSA